MRTKHKLVPAYSWPIIYSMGSNKEFIPAKQRKENERYKLEKALPCLLAKLQEFSDSRRK